jgi:hypothetical protein
MTNTITINSLSTNLNDFHPYVLIPFDKTSMTIPAILFYAVASKIENPRAYFKELASTVKREILEAGVSFDALQGKLSGKVQEFAWCEVIHKAKISDVDLTNFKSAKVIPFEDVIFNGQTTMTVPMFLYDLVRAKHDGVSRQATKYIKEIATKLKGEIFAEYAANANIDLSTATDATLDVLAYELKGKVSHKIQENLWLEFIPASVKNMPLEKIAS